MMNVTIASDSSEKSEWRGWAPNSGVGKPHEVTGWPLGEGRGDRAATFHGDRLAAPAGNPG
jgi:hypothetical protein